MGPSDIAVRLNDLQDRIDSACVKAGRPIGAVELVAMSKLQPVELIEAAFLAGQKSFGENYAQELSSKQYQFRDHEEINWHFTGHLQANKAKLVVGHSYLIQSVDSVKIAGKIARIASDNDFVQGVLIELKAANDTNKSGCTFEAATELCEEIYGMSGIRLQGLMGMAPISSESTDMSPREFFAALREMFERLPAECRKVLSMGMSADYEVAIAEGATMVRIGSAIFGARSHLAQYT